MIQSVVTAMKHSVAPLIYIMQYNYIFCTRSAFVCLQLSYLCAVVEFPGLFFIMLSVAVCLLLTLLFVIIVFMLTFLCG